MTLLFVSTCSLTAAQWRPPGAEEFAETREDAPVSEEEELVDEEVEYRHVELPKLVNEDIGTSFLLRPSMNGEEDCPRVAEIWFEADADPYEVVYVLEEVKANPGFFDEVVFCIESEGGDISDYALVYETLMELRQMPDLRLTVCIDRYACSGGFLIALPAHKILAAPMAEIGAYAPLILVSKVEDPETEVVTNADRKYPVLEKQVPTEIQRESLQKWLSFAERWMADKLLKHRPQTEKQLSVIKSGESWSAEQSVEEDLGLIDELRSSNSYLFERRRTCDIFCLSIEGEFDEEAEGIVIRSLLGSGQ